MEIIKEIKKRNRLWETCTLYEIYEENGEKYIKFTHESYDTSYLRGKRMIKAWDFREFHVNNICKLKDYIEWDCEWAYDNLRLPENNPDKTIYYTPWECYERVCALLGKGRILKSIYRIQGDEECGLYICGVDYMK